MKCKHGYEVPFLRDPAQCRYPTQLDGATVTDLHEASRFEITGRGTSIIVEQMANKRGLVGRTVTIDGQPYEVRGVESCLIPGHDAGHCTCFAGTVVLVAS